MKRLLTQLAQRLKMMCTQQRPEALAAPHATNNSRHNPMNTIPPVVSTVAEASMGNTGAKDIANATPVNMLTSTMTALYTACAVALREHTRDGESRHPQINPAAADMPYKLKPCNR